MILGDQCTRNCGFCAVSHGLPLEPDPKEPLRIAKAVLAMGLRYVVITSVTRDDLEDGGASHFAECIRSIRKASPDVKMEVLTPDFQGNIDSLRKCLEALPDVFNHNLETISRLYPVVRPQANYDRSLLILKHAKEIAPQIKTKSGLMLGLGETIDEVLRLMDDLRAVGCDMLTIGHYMQPTKKNLPVIEYIRPEVFDELKEIALKKGFRYVASAPLVRSSFNAEELWHQAIDCYL